MRVFCIVTLVVTGILAGVSVLAVPLWLLGVPGTDNSYAKGWRLGLYAVLLYPIAWGGLFALWRMIRQQAEGESSWYLWISIGELVALAAAIGVLLSAFKIMSRP